MKGHIDHEQSPRGRSAPQGQTHGDWSVRARKLMLDVNWELSRMDSRGDRRDRVGRREVATPAKVSVVPSWGPELIQIIQNWGE